MLCCSHGTEYGPELTGSMTWSGWDASRVMALPWAQMVLVVEGDTHKDMADTNTAGAGGLYPRDPRGLRVSSWRCQLSITTRTFSNEEKSRHRAICREAGH